ncbi:DNA recombination protein RecF [Rufibacter sp. DG15C]|uniref:DNA replication/repair protein RecF n=1 Tax=Rufibacter sp. DG15C TaxID=1379909 RepID=UPI00078D68B5|nr:DNA replication/repair protein RecF [Rufibacter sp. DG15C]AMM50919.1 DNA recombination protein RecF [Rufibacter sp. DG15C]
MVLENLHLLHFKNYEEATLPFSTHINCFIGDNGSGKTNLLDAIHYLSLTKSAFTGTDLQNIKDGEDYFIVRGRFVSNDKVSAVQCYLKAGQKKIITLNKTPYERVSEHVGQFPVVLISPYDTDLIREGSEDRRKFFDSLMAQLDHSYLDLLIQYNYVLKQRNSLLKQFAEKNYIDREYLQILDEQLMPLGTELSIRRAAFLETFEPVFQRHYQHLSGSSELVTLGYQSQLIRQNYAYLLDQSQRKDLLLQRTTVGPHKDDFVFLMADKSVKNYGSQGQQKSYVIALKLAQFEVLAQKNDNKPLLLLDDIFDRLDEKRITHLMQLVANNTFGQIFLTDTHLDRTDKILQPLSNNIRRFRISEGKAETIEDEDI